MPYNHNTSTTPNATSNNNANSGGNNDSSSGGNTGGNTRPPFMISPAGGTNNNAFEGANTDLGMMLGLRHEKFKIKSSSFESFLEKTCIYVISTYKDGGDLKLLFRKMVDPSTAFKAKKKPTPPPKGGDEVDKDIYREEIKLYVAREANLRRNMEKLFGLIWGQCSS